MFGVIMGISNNYARRANYSMESDDYFKSPEKSTTFCAYENFSPKKGKFSYFIKNPPMRR